MLEEFNALVGDYTNGQIRNLDLGERLYRLLMQSEHINITTMLEHIHLLFTNGKLSAAQYRKLSESLTEQNIRITLNKNTTDNSQNTLSKKNAQATIEPYLETVLLNPQQKTEVLAPKSKTTKRRKESPVTLGTILKNRFVLTEVIGKGGMGFVYKARDLVKVQAQDKNPYVAIKILSEEFKQHQAAFIALQREASKSQRLAHPNIATVYDFDHDDGIIYMTMELMQGQPLDTFIKHIPQGGLPVSQALYYIEQICNGLAYAHAQKLIHCDLKPANIFLNDNGIVKLLDFGITRAIKTESELDEKTLFDPASLKALTPAYASVEMFRSELPDIRDDIYGLACVTYELLAGSHPYKKIAAYKAQELGLKPSPLKKISRQQQKALSKALNLKRDQRTDTVEEFLRGIMPAKSHAKELAIGAMMILIVGAAVLVNPMRKQFQEETRLQLIQSIKSGNRDALVQMIETIDQEKAETRITLAYMLRKEIINYYQDRINNAINAQGKRYDFPKAFALLEEVKSLYPDSASLTEAEKQLVENKARLLNALIDRYHQIEKSGGDTSRIISILREADPENPLLKNSVYK